MAGQSSKTTGITARIPNALLAQIDAAAERLDLSRAGAIVHYLRAGLAAENAAVSPSDIADLKAEIARVSDIQKAQTVSTIDAVRRAIEETPIKMLSASQAELDASAASAREAERERIRNLSALDRLRGNF